MELLYINEHLTCHNYERKNKPTFQNVHFKSEEVFEDTIEEAEIVFVMRGSLYIFNGTGRNIFRENEVILLPPTHHLSITAIEEVFLLVFRIKSPIYLCNVVPLEKLLNNCKKESSGLTYLTSNDRIKAFLDLLSQCLNDGLRCKCLAEIKSKEIFYYFRAYYNKEELRAFFTPLFTKDYEFTVFIHQNYAKMKTVQQFADSYGCSLSSFERQFKKIFKKSAYQWMTTEKSKLIHDDLIHTNRTLLDIADKYDFSSLSQFCDFCKRVLGASPGKIRDDAKCKNTFPVFMNK